MKFYDTGSMFTFGKYEGMTIEEVYATDPGYIKYCEENIDEFYVSPAVMRELKSMNRAINDSALLDRDLDKMTDDEIEEFISGMVEEDDFAQGKIEDDYDWDGNDIPDDSPFDAFEDDFDDDDFDVGFDDEFGDSFDDDSFTLDELF